MTRKHGARSQKWRGKAESRGQRGRSLSDSKSGGLKTAESRVKDRKGGTRTKDGDRVESGRVYSALSPCS